MNIKIDQVAIAVPDIGHTTKHLQDLGFSSSQWAEDEVITKGKVFKKEALSTQASLRFNYELIPGVEFELLHYNNGRNWHNTRPEVALGIPFISHLGMHVKDQEEMDSIKEEMKNKGFQIAQEVKTVSHTNPHIADSRRYHYVIFDSYNRLGFDLKIILRLPYEGEAS